MGRRATVLVAAAVLAVSGCYLVLLSQASAQQAAQGQYDQDGQGTPEPQQVQARSERVTLCHYTGSANNPYVTITVDRESTAFQGHLSHPNDIIPAPPGGCPTGPPGPTTASPTATADPTTPQPTPTATATAGETTGGGGCPDPEPTTASPTATATGEPTATQTATGGAASPGFTPTPTAVATKPGETPDGETEVTSPDGGVSTITLYDLDVDDAAPLPGGPGGITRSEVLGQKAAARALLAGDDFHQAVDAAQPFLNACDSRDAVRLATVQLGIPMPETGGPAALSLIAAALLLGSGIFAWRLGVRGRL